MDLDSGSPVLDELDQKRQVSKVTDVFNCDLDVLKYLKDVGQE